MIPIFLLVIIFGSALFGGINSHLPLIEGDLPILTVLCIIFTGSIIFIIKNRNVENKGGLVIDTDQRKNIFHLPTVKLFGKFQDNPFLKSLTKNYVLPFYSIILFGIMFFALIPFSSYLRLSYLGLLKYSASMIFLYLTWHFLSLYHSKRLSFVLAYAFVIDGIAVLNLFSWIHRIPSETFYGYDPGRGRLFGTMLYCDTAAVYLVPVLFIHLAFIVLTPLKKNKFYHLLGATLCMLNVVLSLSRGTELILVVLYFPIILFLKKANRWQLFWILFTMENSSLLLLPTLMNLYYAHKIYLLYIAIILGICLPSYFMAFGLPKILAYFAKRKVVIKLKQYQTPLISMMIIIGLIIPFWKLPGLAPYNSVRTEWMVKRAAEWRPVIKDGKIYSSDESVNLRIETFRFAAKMFWDKPWLGFGPGTYPLAYLQYRTFNFPWNSPHALPLEKIIDFGIICFLGFVILFWVFFKRVAFVACCSKRYIVRILVCSLIALFGHACLDKDWNYYAVQLDLWLLIGLTLAYYPKTENRRQMTEGGRQLAGGSWRLVIGSKQWTGGKRQKTEICSPKSTIPPNPPLFPPIKGGLRGVLKGRLGRFEIHNRKWLYVFLCFLIVVTIHIWILFAGSICMQIAKTFAKKNDFSNAVHWAKIATKLDGFNADYCVKLAKYINGYGDNPHVSDINRPDYWLKKALDLCSLSSNANYELSKYYRKQGDYSEAEHYWQELERIDPLGDYDPFIGESDLNTRKNPIKSKKFQDKSSKIKRSKLNECNKGWSVKNDEKEN